MSKDHRGHRRLTEIAVRDSFAEPISDPAAATDSPISVDTLAQIRQAICITDAVLDRPGPTIWFVNQAYLDIFGCEESDVMGRSPRFAQGPLTSRLVLDRIRQHLGAGESVRAQAINYRIDRTAFRLRWSIDPIHVDGRPAGFVGVMHDVTTDDRLRRRFAALDGLLAAVRTDEGTHDGTKGSVVATDAKHAKAVGAALRPVLAEVASAVVRVGNHVVELAGPSGSPGPPVVVPIGDVGRIEIDAHPDGEPLLDRLGIDELARHAAWLFDAIGPRTG